MAKQKQPWPQRGLYNLIYGNNVKVVNVLSWIRKWNKGWDSFDPGGYYEYIAMMDEDMDTAMDDFVGNELGPNAFTGTHGYFEQDKEDPNVLFAHEAPGAAIELKLIVSTEGIERVDDNVEQEWR